MKKVIALLVILLALSILAGCGNRLGGTASNEISIQEWLDNKGGTESSTMTVTVKTIVNPVLAIVEDEFGTSLNLFGVMVDGKFAEFENRDDVEKLRKKELFVTRENAVPLHKDEYYISDLEGLTIEDESGVGIGTLAEVITPGANDVYRIELNDGREVLLPAIKQCILQVNIPEGIMKVHIMEGLL